MARHKALVLFKLNSHAKMAPDSQFTAQHDVEGGPAPEGAVWGVNPVKAALWLTS